MSMHELKVTNQKMILGKIKLYTLQIIVESTPRPPWMYRKRMTWGQSRRGGMTIITRCSSGWVFVYWDAVIGGISSQWLRWEIRLDLYLVRMYGWSYDLQRDTRAVRQAHDVYYLEANWKQWAQYDAVQRRILAMAILLSCTTSSFWFLSTTEPSRMHSADRANVHSPWSFM